MDILSLVAIPFLILVNAVFVAVEFALVAVRKTRIEEMIQQGVRGATSLQDAQRDLDRSIAAAQLGITVASIILGAVAETGLARLIEPLLGFIPPEWQAVSRHSVAMALALVIITFVHVILGEQIPKMIAIQKPDETALWFARPLNVFAKVCYPILKMMNGMSYWLMRRIGLQPTGEGETPLSVEELRMVIGESEEAGHLDSDEAEILRNVFRLTNKTVRDCMIPKEKMDALEIHTPSEKILEKVRSCGHTRLPVYDTNLDNIVGILNSKHLFYYFSLANVIVLEDTLYPATFLGPDEVIATALRLFRKTHKPMALVRDGEGHILGMLTLEDVIEEIVGDLEDEHDLELTKVSRTEVVRHLSSVRRTGMVPREKGKGS